MDGNRKRIGWGIMGTKSLIVMGLYNVEQHTTFIYTILINESELSADA